MKLRLHIDALSIEADWPRAGRAAFAEALRAALQTEMAEAARCGALGPRIETRRALTIPALSLASPQLAASSVARAIAGEIAPVANAGARSAPGSGKPR